MKRFFVALLFGIAGALSATVLHYTGWLTFAENHTWDLRMRLWTPPQPSHPRIKLVLIDQPSLDWAAEQLGVSWPWPREMYAAVVGYAFDAGAQAVVFDVLFSDASTYGVEDDGRFADSLQLLPVAGSVALERNGGRTEASRLYLPGVPCADTGFIRAKLPNALLRDRFAALGSVNSTLDFDGIIRRTQPVACLNGRAVASLPLAAYRMLHPKEPFGFGPERLTLGDRTIVLDEGAARIRFHGPAGHYARFSVAAMIQSKLLHDEGSAPLIAPEQLAGSIIIFGMSAPGLMDLRTTPFQSAYPGAEVHATILDNLMMHDFFEPVDTLFIPVTALLLAAVAAYLILALRTLAAMVLIFFGLSFSVTAAVYAAFSAGFVVQVVPTFIALIIGTLGAFALNYFREGQQRRFIRLAFAQYLSPAVIDQLVRHPESLRLGGEQKTLTLFFSDIEGFTTISTGLEPVALTQFLNRYLGALSDIILALGGTIDKYEGDAIIAFWNAPLDQDDHARRAVEAALRIQEHLMQERATYRELCGRELRTRIGIHTGDVVVGNMGTVKRFDYTFIGDAGNLAARLEGANKRFGTYTMISEATRESIADIDTFRELGRIRVVGRKAPIRVCVPLRSMTDTVQRFNAGMQLIEQGRLHEASRIFEALDDGPAGKCLEIIAAIETGRLTLDEGVLELHEK